MYRYLNQLSESSQLRTENCVEKCDKCKMCKQDTRDFDDCWKDCDDCNRCHADYLNSRVYNEPYEYRPWFLTPFNHTYTSVPYSKQFTDNLCGQRVGNLYRQRYNDYKQCQRCQLQGKCWSTYHQKCVDCEYERANTSCERRFGCRNVLGNRWSPPIDPMLTQCTPCWDQNTYTTM